MAEITWTLAARLLWGYMVARLQMIILEREIADFRAPLAARDDRHAI